MNFWWVNHNQTHKQEIGGGYIWSPKTNKDGARNQFYINLTEARNNDIVFSYANGEIGAIGTVVKEHATADRPTEFGSTGQRWNIDGWLVRIRWISLDRPLVPIRFIAEIRDLLPAKYSPITQAGKGNQGCYLASITDELGLFLTSKAYEANDYFRIALDDHEERKVGDQSIPETEKDQLIKARRGQGLFRDRLADIENRCRLTGVDDIRFLTASHIKPWRDCNNSEKLDGNNGLFLSPHVDRLFDRGWISFNKSGEILCANPLARRVMISWNLDPTNNVGVFSETQDQYLAFHRSNIYKGN